MKQKQLKLVLLPTENKTNALLGWKDRSKLFVRPYTQEYSDEDLDRYESAYFHLYAMSDEIPKKGDWFLLNEIPCIMDDTVISPESYRKIIVSTCNLSRIEHDDTISYPKGRQIFVPTFTNDFINTYIEMYNKNEIIERVEVNYELIEDVSKPYTDKGQPAIEILEVNPDNTVDVSLIEDKNNRLEELVDLLEKAGIRKFTCVNNFGYSQVERDIVDLFSDKLYTKEEVINLFSKYQYDLSQWVLRMEDDMNGKPMPVEWIKNNL
jgi:hypothetical protein